MFTAAIAVAAVTVCMLCVIFVVCSIQMGINKWVFWRTREILHLFFDFMKSKYSYPLWSVLMYCSVYVFLAQLFQFEQENSVFMNSLVFYILKILCDWLKTRESYQRRDAHYVKENWKIRPEKFSRVIFPISLSFMQ